MDVEHRGTIFNETLLYTFYTGFDLKTLIHHVRTGNKNDKSEHFSLTNVVFLRTVMRPVKCISTFFTISRMNV